MKIKVALLSAVIALVSLNTMAQSKTTEALAKKYDGSLSLFFYNNTLRMLNQSEDPAFDDLIKDIEKMKLLMINKTEYKMDATGYKQIVKEYKADAFEEMMTSRFEGKNFDVFVKEKDGKTKGILVLVNDTESLFVLDILGSINVSKVTQLYSTLDKSSDIGEKIKAFAKPDKRNDREGRDDDDDRDDHN